MEINFQVGRNYYHTLHEAVTGVDGGMINGTADITGFSPQPISEGDILNISGIKYTVRSCVRRDHNGVFANKQDAVNGHFTADCTFQKVMPSK